MLSSTFLLTFARIPLTHSVSKHTIAIKKAMYLLYITIVPAILEKTPRLLTMSVELEFVAVASALPAVKNNRLEALIPLINTLFMFNPIVFTYHKIILSTIG
jgi:hypothetical protein